MINYIEYLGVPTFIGMIIVGLFLFIQIIGELLEFKGKVVPEIMKVRKYFSRKKQEREVLSQLPEVFKDFKQVSDTLNNVQTLFSELEKHYNSDNIAMRDEWIKNVNTKLEEHDDWRKEFDKKLNALLWLADHLEESEWCWVMYMKDGDKT